MSGSLFHWSASWSFYFSFHCFTPLCQVAVKAAESHDTSYKDQATWHVCASCDNGVRSQLLCLHTNTRQKSILSYKKRWSGCTETVPWLWTFWDSNIPGIQMFKPGMLDSNIPGIFLQTPRNLLQPMPSIDALRCGQLQVNQHCELTISSLCLDLCIPKTMLKVCKKCYTAASLPCHHWIFSNW